MEASQPKSHAHSLKDPVRVLALMQLLGGLAGIGLYLAGLVPFTGAIGGATTVFLAWVCVTQAERPEWRKKGAPLAALSLALFVFAMALSLLS